MFRNSGKSCKDAAHVLFVLQMTGCVLTSILLLGRSMGVASLLISAGVLLFGAIFAWIMAAALYTIGDIWDALHERDQFRGADPDGQLVQEEPKADYVEALRNLKAQHDAGEITEEEFSQKKQEILDTLR